MTALQMATAINRNDNFGPHRFECLPGLNTCSICGLRSVDRRRHDQHMFSNDLGEVKRTAKEIAWLRSQCRIDE